MTELTVIQTVFIKQDNNTFTSSILRHMDMASSIYDTDVTSLGVSQNQWKQVSKASVRCVLDQHA
jgi:hypothetical protein